MATGSTGRKEAGWQGPCGQPPPVTLCQVPRQDGAQCQGRAGVRTAR